MASAHARKDGIENLLQMLFHQRNLRLNGNTAGLAHYNGDVTCAPAPLDAIELMKIFIEFYEVRPDFTKTWPGLRIFQLT